MALGKQAKVLNRNQFISVANYISSGRNGLRNKVILYLSFRAGLRAKEIAALRWSMVLDSDGVLDSCLNLTNEASKGTSGRSIPINQELKTLLAEQPFLSV